MLVLATLAVVARSFGAPADAPGKIEACGDVGDQDAVCRWVYDLTDSVGLAEVADTVSKPLRAVAVVLVAFIATRVAKRIVHRTVRTFTSRQALGALDRATAIATVRQVAGHAELDEIQQGRRDKRAQTISNVGSSVVSFVIWLIALFFVLSIFDVDTAALIAGAGFLGIAFGFGAQKLIADFTTGLFMVVEDQFGVGDVIDVGDARGTVEKVTLRVTQVRDVEGVLWYVPNGEINRVANHSQMWARAVLDIDVAYDSDIGTVKSVIESTAKAMFEDPEWRDEILEQPEVWGVEAFGPDAISIRLVIKTAPLDQWVVAREMRARIKESFDREGIEIPFPQRTIWIRSDLAGETEPRTGASERSERPPDPRDSDTDPRPADTGDDGDGAGGAGRGDSE